MLFKRKDGKNMKIKSIKISNFKIFKNLKVDFENFSILVGDNGTGKSTLLEAIHLALTGYYHGKSINGNISQDLFNIECIKEYIDGMNKNSNPKLPEIIIEVFFDECPILMGDDNSTNSADIGFAFKIIFDENNKDAYAEFIKQSNFNSLPFEFYKCEWNTFARKSYTNSKTIEFKSAFLNNKNDRLSDLFSTRLIRNSISDESKIMLNQKIRSKTESLGNDEIFKDINNTFKNNSDLKLKNITIGVLNNNQSSWENLITLKENGIPYENIGTGNQCILNTIFSLNNEKNKNKGVILIEEPENHLSGMSLNILLKNIKDNVFDQQIIITTHSSYVLNKLGMNNLILVNKEKCLKFNVLSEDTINYFEKLSGYDTLRFILCKQSMLVEGDSDDLIIQRAYKEKNKVLPIDDGIEIITVGIAYKRFLELAKKLNLNTILITDNDGDLQKIEDLKNEYGSNNIKIFSGEKVFTHDELGFNKELIKNVNTLEPEILRANDLKILNKILDKNYDSNESMCHYMINNKTDVAWKIFNNNETIKFPKYINDAIEALSKNE